MAMGEYMA